MAAGLLFVGLWFVGMGPVSAATCTNSGSGEKSFTLTAAVGDACFASAGSGNINGKDPSLGGNANSWDDFLNSSLGANYVTLDVSNSTEFDLTGGALGGVPATATTGTWTINSVSTAGYAAFVIGLKSGNSWGAFLIPANVFSGFWSSTGGLSHAVLYGQLSAIPVPAALPLMAAGMGLLGLLGWRRKSQSAA